VNKHKGFSYHTLASTPTHHPPRCKCNLCEWIQVAY